MIVTPQQRLNSALNTLQGAALLLARGGADRASPTGGLDWAHLNQAAADVERFLKPSVGEDLINAAKAAVATVRLATRMGWRQFDWARVAADLGPLLAAREAEACA